MEGLDNGQLAERGVELRPVPGLCQFHEVAPLVAPGSWTGEQSIDLDGVAVCSLGHLLSPLGRAPAQAAVQAQ